MPLQATSGAASYDAFGGGVPVVPQYIEDYFSTFLYTGNGTTRTINNGIDLAGKGGMVWTKIRSNNNIGFTPNVLIDTARGFNFSGTQIRSLFSNTTGGESDSTLNNAQATALSNGFSYATSAGNEVINGSGFPYVSWTWAKAPKFFDVVTYTGNGAGPQVINHNLGSAPGCVIVKSVSNTSVWWVWHRGNGGSTDLTGIELNSTSASTFPNAGVASDFTATTFNAGSLINVALNLNPNVNGQTYVAYLFAHNAGGFGLTGTDNVISCGSFTTDGSGNATVNLGYEPQWLLYRRSQTDSNWFMIDTMRGWDMTNRSLLNANLSDAESTAATVIRPTATGFSYTAGSTSSQFIYIAIRRGPMKVPTTGTSVFDADTYTGNGTAGRLITTNFPVDMVIGTRRSDVTTKALTTRLTGASLRTNDTIAEEAARSTFDSNIGNLLTASYPNTSGDSSVQWAWQRAPGFFDVVCYTGTGSDRTVTHNLAAVPELMIVKSRNAAYDWAVYSGNRFGGMSLNSTAAYANDAGWWSNTNPTASVLTVGNAQSTNNSGTTYVAYLFASCPGVSKVFNFTGNGSSQTINCGFTGGARFVMIKRTDSTGDWYVWDTARGIVVNNDPHLSLNTTAAEVTSNDTIDTDSTGFVVNQVSATNVNVNGASYIGLAIA